MNLKDSVSWASAQGRLLGPLNFAEERPEEEPGGQALALDWYPGGPPYSLEDLQAHGPS